MDWQERMNAALDYVEDNLDGDISWEAAAACASCSTFHFLRMFEVVSGISAGEYARRRRLSLAALDLARGEVKVIDLALRLGYDSPDAFARAFKREFGVTPTDARAPGVPLRTWPRFSFSIVLKGTTPMNFRIESREAMKLTGLPLSTTVADSRQLAEIPAFWDRVMADGSWEKLLKAVPAYSQIGVAGVSADMDPSTEQFTYLIAIETPADRSGLPVGCVERTTKAATWAIFESRGPLPKGIQETIGRIYGEWFPTSGYEHSGGPELEVYPEGDTSAADYYCEAWIPVKKVARAD
jgi:AraC family transcriptional regulator